MIEVEDPVCALTSLRRAEGEKGLLRSLLVDAMRCLCGEAGGPPAKRLRLAEEARAWIASGDDTEPFAFENVCEWLGLPAGRLRAFLLEQAANRDPSALIDRRGTSRHAGVEAWVRGERNARIHALRSAGWKPREIAARFGLSYESILFICAEERTEAVDESDDGQPAFGEEDSEPPRQASALAGA